MEYIRREWKVSAPGYFGWETNTGWCKNKIIIKKIPNLKMYLCFIWTLCENIPKVFAGNLMPL